MKEYPVKNQLIPRPCMMISRFHPVIGGSETQLLCLSRQLKKDGFEPFIVTERWENVHPAYEIIEGLPVRRISVARPSWLREISHIFMTMAFFWRYRRSYDILHTHSNVPLGAYAVLIGRLFRKKVVVKIATAGKLPRLKGRIPSHLLVLLLRYSDAVICLSDEIRKELTDSKMSAEKIYYIPNGVDTDKFRLISTEEKKRLKHSLGISDGVVGAYVGRIVYRKGIDVLLEAWRNVLIKNRNAKLFIIGSGTYQKDSTEDQHRDFVAKHGLKDSVILPGKVTDPEKYLMASDFFVLPSRREGMPNSLLEAMSCGLPVVATQIGGITDVIKNRENGILVPTDCSDRLADAINEVISDHDLSSRIKANARETIESRYSIKAIASKYGELYKELHNRKNRIVYPKPDVRADLNKK